ncbi:PIG-L deacetylase family protein [Brevibacillus ginsengisoli]|uniref:PIG-L deacetylase family protein n=1 Tax=Brevibacillus ginsengisoli TaxID=363854 RepID=UPI003CF33D67
MQHIQMGKRLLVIAPHPDDEALGSAGIIQHALASGNQVKVVLMTTGDGFTSAVEVNYQLLSPGPSDYRRMGEERHLETLAAMTHLGVPKENVIFLGYPDGGVNTLWQSNWDTNNLLRATNGSERAPYAFSYEKNAPYCGENVVKNLTKIIHDYQPTDIVYPDPNDQHPDHWATNAFVKYVLAEQHYHAQELTYLVHRGDFPVPWLYRPNHSLNPPHALVGLDTRWVHLPMNEQEEQKKREAISKYVTQVKVMNPFLEAFVRTNELVGTYVPAVLPHTTGQPNVNQLEKTSITFCKDAMRDTIRRELHKEADIYTVGGVQSDHGIHIRLDTRAPINARVTYNIRLRIFEPGIVRRIDLAFYDSKLTSSMYASNSLKLPPGSAYLVKDNRLWVHLPAILTDQTTDFLISADTLVGNELVDKTAWQLVRVK